MKTRSGEGVAVNAAKLVPYVGIGVPEFVKRGYYVAIDFQCAECGRVEVWTAAQQKWWYEVARGALYSTAKLCRPCRRRRNEQRRKSLDGVERKRAGKTGAS